MLFPRGSGSSRRSPRNQLISRYLLDAGLATLLLDLLTTTEEAYDRATGKLRFDVLHLADRPIRSAEWVRGQPGGQRLRIGYLGAGTGAAAALIAAAARPEMVGAIVSRGGRSDLAGDVLDDVWAPALLIVGGDDRLVRDLNEFAFTRLRCEKRMEVVSGATHLFEEPGTLEQLADLASAWFRHLFLADHSDARGPSPFHPRPW